MTVKTIAFIGWIILTFGYGAYLFYIGYTNSAPDWTHLPTLIYAIMNAVAACYLVYRDRWGKGT